MCSTPILRVQEPFRPRRNMELTKEKEFVLRNMAVARAQGDPLPGPLSDAFSSEPIRVGELEVRPIVAGDWIILKKLDSPLYRMVLERDDKSPAEFTDEEGIEMCFQFTRSVREVRKALARGRDEFREAALQSISDKYDSPTISKLVMAVGEQLKRAYETAIKYVSPDDGGGERRNFQEPPA